jgi:SDR family mycofactocin-dependent oxidoreductase
MGALEGRVALVTGGARGQGRSHALALAQEGADVVVADLAAPLDTVPYDLASPADLEETVAQVRAGGGRAEGIVADVRDTAQIEAAVKVATTGFGGLDILVANAGIVNYAEVGSTSDDVWEELIDTNLTGVFKSLRAAQGPMAERGWGRVVVTASGAGRTAIRNLGAYSASKWGVIGLVKTFALETARLGITANVVCPGTVHTPMVDNDLHHRLFRPDVPTPTAADAAEEHRTQNPMHKVWLEPEDVTRAVMYFVTEPGMVSGSVLEVDMGSAARHV